MSFDINWDKLNEDNTINESIRDFLNDQVQGLELPDYLMNIKVSKFSLGTIAPEITIRHIGDPFNDFYDEDSNGDDIEGSERHGSVNGSEIQSQNNNKKLEIDKRHFKKSIDQSSNISPNQSIKDIDDEKEKEDQNSLHSVHTNKEEVPSESLKNEDVSNDIQFIVEIDYKGDITIEIQVDLLLNYPSPGFITLPVTLRIVDLGIHSLAVLAHVNKIVYLSFLCDINDEIFDDIIKNPNLSKNSNRNRIDIIRNLRIESEIGDTKGEGSVLKNVGKVERFLTDMIRSLLRDELAWPGWISFDFNESDDEEGDDDEDDEGI
ncbi:hypothetical protein BN7_1457 [Wickerhamomyces ciferrii]|uniref:Mitochondrial distribution and morphology protein 12 n=1 Tax=Wickerhamomyces ciferrii (strain ATCC 14091 / BCRC 22168 / CBS 111 / JCM 3599 / NBRC 0793 / NRRL Y-1031 F-60-10) TaxID=1206466 RepID=K0KLC4_WICCF|nr:uncharacterized protein BN7_1457 [Wickerhamomyces ciferrii]CCH41918.1 hypothetical protein BN7_1457 [Wickerhamomyces ciferrii]